MSFADWKARSKLFQAFKNRAERYGIGYEEVAQAAYKAGERDGRKQAEAVAAQAIQLRDQLRHNAEFCGGPLAGSNDQGGPGPSEATEG